MERPNSIVLLSSKVMISEESKLHPVFLTVRFLLASTCGNLNKEGVTKAFIDDLVSRHEVFECLPMYVDMDRLLARDYDNLTHLYNRVTKKFSTSQFGSLTNFYEETDDEGVTSLYAEARFPKREFEACTRLVELYDLGKLRVSVEIRFNPEYTIKEDGVMYIDANEDNALTGLCIVSEPAEQRAVALDMVAEKKADDSPIVTDGEEPMNRGETDLKDEEKMTAEVIEDTDTAVAETQEADAVGEPTVVAETAVAEEDPQGTEDAEDPEDPEDDKEDKEDVVAEAQESATAEVLEHSVDTHESVENWGGEPVHVIEYHERVIETMEEAGTVIAELETQIAELQEIKVKYDAIIAEREAAELADKQSKAQAFAEKQGLDVTVAEVQEAIKALDYTKIAELTMAQVQDEEEVREEPVKQTISLASFVDLEVGNDNAYGGLLKRRGEK